MTSLAGLQVLVTRPDPAGAHLCEAIQTAGGVAIHLPTIDFAPPVDSIELSLATLDQQNWLVFVSPRAVYSSVPAIRRMWPELPDNVKFAAVGAGTAKALHDAGYLTAVHPEGEWNTESVLALPAFQSVKGQKIAIIRGAGGREKLDHVFNERGADVTTVIAYQRILPVIDVQEYIALAQQQQINVMVCTSFDGVRHLKLLMGDAAWPAIKNIPLIVVSDRIKGLARDLDFQPIWVAKNASHEAIVEVLAQKKEEICRIQQTKL